MFIDGSIRRSCRQPTTKKQNHSLFFQDLELKLLQQSQKITNLMGKSVVLQNKQIKVKLPPSRTTKTLADLKSTLINQQSPRNSALSSSRNLPENDSIKKAKQLCSILRQSANTTEQLRCTTQTRQETNEILKYDRVGPLTIVQHPILTKRRRNQKQEKQRVQKLMAISEGKSLKDTMETQSCLSMRSGEQLQACTDKLNLTHFHITRYLSQGRQGIVFQAIHKKTNFICALKKIGNSLFLQDPKMLTQRIRQIKIQSFLDHPNIVHLYSVFVDKNDLYLVMELCSSGTLYEQLRKQGRFSQQKVRSIIRQVCHAVEYMHDHDILHRDIKPQNILFHENVVKLADFGWSVSSPLLRDTLCGTPVYSSPEQVQKQQYDNKIDVWNIGVLTYQLVYGKVPFQIRTIADMQLVVDEDIYFPKKPAVSKQIKDFIMKCLSKNPKERCSLAKLLDHQFINPSGLL